VRKFLYYSSSGGMTTLNEFDVCVMIFFFFYADFWCGRIVIFGSVFGAFSRRN
jgi:hypothetical protein